MIITSFDGNKKIQHISDKVAELIFSGVSSDKILVLCLNSFKKEKLISQITEKLLQRGLGSFSQLNVATFAGITYNSISKNWIQLEELLQKSGGDIQMYPTLSGLDASQYFFRKIIKEEDFQDYFSKKNLMHQLLRRYKLIVENSLSDIEIEERSKLLGETFAQSASLAIKKYKIISSKNRIFDNLKQISSFLYLLKNNQIKDFEKIEYFFADDVDEYSYAGFEFCSYMIKNAKQSYVYLDKEGCSRKGYLCGYDDAYNDIKKVYKAEENFLEGYCPLLDDASTLADNLINKESKELLNFEAFIFSKRIEMIEAVAKDIKKIIKNGVRKRDIQIVTPLIDGNLIYSLKEFLNSKGIKLQFLTGNKKITEDIYVYAMITVFQLLNSHWGIKPNSFDIRVLLNEILQIPIFASKDLIFAFNKTGVLPKDENIKYSQYNLLLELIYDEDLQSKKLSEQFEEIFSRIIAPNAIYGNDFEAINLLLKSINEYEKIKENFKKFDDINLEAKDWLLHIKNSVVSQNPSKPAHIDDEAIIVSTAQKIVDFSLEAKYQFWLDTTSNEWIKEDIGTIYNAWVFQKNYLDAEYNSQTNKDLTYEKAARLLRKLTLCAKEKIFCYSSIYDALGRENYGELGNYIKIANEKAKEFNFVPRDDQQEILNYKSGKMAVPAVPGAGKTTVMLALLVQLVKLGTKPQDILVLTYMESAARNFLNRFKKVTQTRTNLPQISTIHSFAFKILMENNNYAFVNLPEDFSICDDALKTALIKAICSANLPVGENLDDWCALMISGISKVKINRLEIDKIKTAAQNDGQIREFLQIYSAYNEKLKELSLLDYDDLLVYAIALLKSNPSIARDYQNKFKFIIEDEAQDSSAIQQEFISILSAKHNNVIRCGDVNQAILGTFSNSDVRGFKEFISKNKKVEMYRSQRCAKQIYTLANELINYTKQTPILEDAFYDLKMQGVNGKNPVSKEEVMYKKFENPIDEKEFVISDIKKRITQSEKPPTFAILLRTNKQVSAWAGFLEKQGVSVICRGDSHRQKKVFNFILSAIDVFLSPWDNKMAAKLYKEFCNIERFKFDEGLFEYIEKNENIFFHPEFLKKAYLNKADLEDFWWEGFSIAESKTLDIQEIVMACANRYFDDVIDRSNAYLFSVLIKRYENTLISDEKFKLNYIPEMVKYFKNLLAQKTLKGLTLFAKEDEDDDLNGYVQIMTIHKAKGAEFDYVYLPEFTDYNYSLNFAKCAQRIQKRKKTLLSKIDKLIFGTETLASTVAKEEIEETLRLLYVAITRAKLGLNFTYSLKNDFQKENIPVDIVQDLIFSSKTFS